MTYRVEFDREEDGRWIALVPDLPGVMVYGDSQEDAVLINRFMKIVDRVTINGDADANYRLRVNGDTILNGLTKVISTLSLEAVGGNLYLHTASDKSVLGLTVVAAPRRVERVQQGRGG